MARRFLVVGAVVFLGAGANILAQAMSGQAGPPPGQAAPPASTGTALVLGRVLDGLTERPIAAAMITLFPVGAAGPGAPFQPQRVVADAQGRFIFRDLPAGRFTFGIVSPGYTSGGFGARRAGGLSQTLELADAEKHTDAVIRLWPTAVITGTVRDEAGEPVAGVPVGAFRRANTQGLRQTSQLGQTTTDDRGIFRFALLPPGDYLVAVQAWRVSASSGGAMPAGRGQGPAPRPVVSIGGIAIEMPQPLIPPAGPDGVLRVYPTTFAPRATTPEAATLVSVAAGEEKNADVQLSLAPARRVSGRVVSSSTSVDGVTVRLVPGAAQQVDGLEASSARTSPDGTFTFDGVPTGEYTAVVRILPTARPPGGSPNAAGPVPVPAGPGPAGVVAWATTAVNVGDSDVAGVLVALNEGRRLSGRIEFDGTRPRPAAADLERIVFSFVSSTSQGRTRTDATGAFVSDPVVPDEYGFQMNSPLPQGWTLQSAMAGARDVSDRGLAVGVGELPEIVVTLTDAPTTLGGTVRTSGGAGDPNALVVVFPAERDRWTERGARSLRVARVAASGGYSLTGLPKGNYFVAAVDDARAGRFPEPEWLESVAGLATLVTIDNRERRTLDLRTVVLP